MRPRCLEFSAVSRTPKNPDRARPARLASQHIVLAVADHHRRMRSRTGRGECASKRDFLRLDSVLVVRREDHLNVRTQPNLVDHSLSDWSVL